MAQCSQSASVSSSANGELKKDRKVAVITGITGQVTFPHPAADCYAVT